MQQHHDKSHNQSHNELPLVTIPVINKTITVGQAECAIEITQCIGIFTIILLIFAYVYGLTMLPDGYSILSKNNLTYDLYFPPKS